MDEGMLLRGFAGLGGLLLLLAGGRVWRVAVVAPGLIAGSLAGAWLASTLQFPVVGTMAVAAVGAAIGGAVAGLAERAALIGVGALVGLGAVAMIDTFAAAPLWAWPVAGLVGAGLFPAVWRGALVPITACAGAVCVAWAFDRAELWVVMGLAVVGTGVQIAALARAEAE